MAFMQVPFVADGTSAPIRVPTKSTQRQIVNSRELAEAATLIARANTTADVVAVTVAWDECSSKLTVTYYVDDTTSEATQYFCELALTEMLAQFADVKLAASLCIDSQDAGDLRRLPGLVYVRAD